MPIFALLPAAGTSARMGRPKLALLLGGRTVLERVIDTVRSANIPDILVVLGPQVADLKAVAEGAGARTLLLDQQTPDMRATIQCGLDWLTNNEHPRQEDAFLLLPADHPTLSTECVNLLTRARLVSSGEATIWVPTYEGRRGHPTLISWSHVEGIAAIPADQGLNVYVRSHASETMEVRWSSDEILCDLDTPADFEHLQSQFAKRPL